MNCQDFESNIDALARGALMDARAREIALAHESACARCAARSADERALTSGLRALAADTKEREAPARVEAALLDALRARAASRIAVAETPHAPEGAHDAAAAPGVGVAPLAGEMVVKPWSWMRTVAVASLAAAAALALFMLIPPTVPRTNVAVAGNQTTGQVQSAAPTGTFENAAQKNEQTEQTIANVGAITSPMPLPDVDEKDSRAAVPHRPSGRVVQAMNAVLSRSGVRGSQTRRGLAQTASGNEEVTTDFIPLMQGERLAQGEGGNLVRVELPRSALERFGLPINAERTGGRVKADVLLGEDGVARAIRFVR
jgi:hypothetical protein